MPAASAKLSRSIFMACSCHAARPSGRCHYAAWVYTSHCSGVGRKSQIGLRPIAAPVHKTLSYPQGFTDSTPRLPHNLALVFPLICTAVKSTRGNSSFCMLSAHVILLFMHASVSLARRVSRWHTAQWNLVQWHWLDNLLLLVLEQCHELLTLQACGSRGFRFDSCTARTVLIINILVPS